MKIRKQIFLIFVLYSPQVKIFWLNSRRQNNINRRILS